MIDFNNNIFCHTFSLIQRAIKTGIITGSFMSTCIIAFINKSSTLAQI